MTERDRVLRAAVYSAFDVRGQDGYREACRRVVDIDLLWPLVEANRELERARTELAERRARSAEIVELLRSTQAAT